MKICTAQECRDSEARFIESSGIEVTDLIWRAADAILKEIVGLVPLGATIRFACGGGNNGADGVAAAKLAAQAGFTAICHFLVREEKLSPSLQNFVRRARSVGVGFKFGAQSLHLPCDLWVDALLGTGSHGELRPPMQAAIAALNSSSAKVLSVDIPSGLHPDTGGDLGGHIRAHTTVTFGSPKRGFFQGMGPAAVGKLMIAEIGLPESPNPACPRLTQGSDLALPPRLDDSHKGSTGRVLIKAGSKMMPGAAVLAVHAALRMGAGLVTLQSDSAVREIVAHHHPECVFLDSEAEIDEGRFDAAVFGPGLSLSEESGESLRKLWQSWTKPCVIDADALTWVAQGIPLPKAQVVMTPHPKEMARLLGVPTEKILESRFDSVEACAAKFGCTAILKGRFTMISSPGGVTHVNPTGNSGMATGGMGDVLSGVIGALLAQGAPTDEAAIAGVFLHGLAGDLCRDSIGEFGYFASEVADELPAARAKLPS